MKGQNEGADVFNGSIKVTDTSSFNFLNSIEIDSIRYIPYQVTFNANKDTWSGEFYQINLNSNTTGFQTTVTQIEESSSELLTDLTTTF